MVNILIHQFQPGDVVVDKAALEQFEKQWATYQKVVDADWLSHKAVGKLLHDTLNQTFAAPFFFAANDGAATRSNAPEISSCSRICTMSSPWIERLRRYAFANLFELAGQCVQQPNQVLLVFIVVRYAQALRRLVVR